MQAPGLSRRRMRDVEALSVHYARRQCSKNALEGNIPDPLFFQFCCRAFRAFQKDLFLEENLL